MSDTDDLIRRAEAWLSKLPRPVQYAEAVAVLLTESPDLVRELLAAVKGLREQLDALDTDDRVLVRALMAESDAGKAVQRVEALAGDLAAHSRVDPTDPDADVIREAEDSIAHWLRQALKGTDE